MKYSIPLRHIPSLLLQFNRQEAGQALVMMATAIAVLMLMTGFGIEVGLLKYQQQQMQKAADAGAIAGASTKIYGGDYQASAREDTAANGFTDTINGTTITVNSPPLNGPFASAENNTNYVEVIVSQPQPTFFMKVGGFDSVAVSARAVASSASSSSGCIYVLDPHAATAYQATGTTTVSANCGLQINSDSPNAYDDNGGACTTMSGISVVGGIKNNACSTPAPSTGGSRFSDPLSELPAPAKGTCTAQSGKITGGTVTLSEGTFCGGIQISGTSPIVTFNPGVYILYGGGLSIAAGAQVNALGVTFYNTGTSSGPTRFQAISINGTSNSHFAAPTSGTYEAILFFEDRAASSLISNPNNTINGGSNTTFDGALYFSSSDLNYSGNSSSQGYSIIVANQLKITGNTTVGVDYSSLDDDISPIHSAVLAE